VCKVNRPGRRPAKIWTLLRDELDKFTKGRVHHQVSFGYSSGQEMVICEITVKNVARPLDVSVNRANERLNTALSKLNSKLKQQFSQWIYVSVASRIFDDQTCISTKLPPD